MRKGFYEIEHFFPVPPNTARWRKDGSIGGGDFPCEAKGLPPALRHQPLLSILPWRSLLHKMQERCGGHGFPLRIDTCLLGHARYQQMCLVLIPDFV